MKLKNKDWIVKGNKYQKRAFLKQLKDYGFVSYSDKTDWDIVKDDGNIGFQNNYVYQSCGIIDKQYSGYYKIFDLSTDWNKAIEYITEKEPKIELNNWYWTVLGSLYFIDYKDSGILYGYGIDSCGNWIKYQAVCRDENLSNKATKDEIEREFIKEAKRRYNEGDKVRLLSFNYGGDDGEIIKFRNMNMIGNQLYINGNLLVFDKGEWAEVIEKKVESSDYLVNELKIEIPYNNESRYWNIYVKPINPAKDIHINTSLEKSIDEDKCNYEKDYKKLYDKTEVQNILRNISWEIDEDKMELFSDEHYFYNAGLERAKEVIKNKFKEIK